jgi:hypothetical protein
MMKTIFLKFFNAILAATISLLGFTTCAKKTYPQEKVDNIQSDSIKSGGHFNESPQIRILYGAPAPNFRQQ